ncbi:hypothetical protein BSKO_00855 [Bryopsis sp. KO-2023]|nr:hypothetical protein BSKO_00855 [Bryopsis sp. KO-2023]
MSAYDTLRQSLGQQYENFKTIKKDIQKNHQTRQQLIQQKSENEMVLEELALFSDDANVYKLIGPALIKQDPIEAKANVSKRIEFISGELDRLDNQLKSLETKANQRQEEILKMQKKIQTLQQQQQQQS